MSVGVAERTAAEHALHHRRALALRAAVEAGLPGRYEAFEVDGLLVSIASPPDLPFLRTIQGVTAASLDRLDDVLERCGDDAAPALTVHADRAEALGGALRARGFAPAGEAPLLVAALPTGDAPRPAPPVSESSTAPPVPAAPEPTVVPVDAGSDLMDVFVAVLDAGYRDAEVLDHRDRAEHPTGPFLRTEHRSLELERYLATVEGRPVGAAAMSLHQLPDGPIAVLGGAATLPAARRRGVQQALLHRRLEDATTAGCTLVTSTASPASRSLRNLERAGLTHVRRELWVRRRSDVALVPPG